MMLVYSKLDIDFVAKPRRPGPLMALVLLVLTGVLVWGLYRYGTLSSSLADSRQQMADLRRSHMLALSAVAPPAPPMAPERSKAVIAAVGALNVPWPELLRAIERSKPAQAALLRVEPRPKDRAVLITAQASNVDTLVDFMDALAQTSPFVRIRPLRQEALPKDGPVGLQTTFEAFWETAP